MRERRPLQANAENRMRAISDDSLFFMLASADSYGPLVLRSKLESNIAGSAPAWGMKYRVKPIELFGASWDRSPEFVMRGALLVSNVREKNLTPLLLGLIVYHRVNGIHGKKEAIEGRECPSMIHVLYECIIITGIQ